MSENKPYEYFDTPVGEDVFKKLWIVLKPAALWAGGLGIIDVMLVSHPKGYLPTVGRMAYIASPFLGSATVFVCTSNVLANLRKKDDKLNWFVSGFMAGSVFGMWRRNTALGFNMGLAFGLMGVLKKHCLEKGYTILPLGRNTPSMNAWDYDWSLTKERPKGYVTK